MAAINFCIRRQNQGDRTYARAALELYREALARDILLENGVLPPYTYNNIHLLAQVTGERAWAPSFLDQYRPALPAAGRDNIYRYNVAIAHFRAGEYGRVLELLQEVTFSEVFINLDVRRMLLKSYFEMGEWLSLASLLESFAVFIRRQKELGYHRESYLNLIKFTKKLAKKAQTSSWLKLFEARLLSPNASGCWKKRQARWHFKTNYFIFACKKMPTLDSNIEYLKGVGPQRAEALKLELGIFTCRDLLFHFPFRYIDRTKFHKIRDIHNEGEQVQIRGTLRRLETLGEGRARRLVGSLRDETGMVELVWFQAINWLEKSLTVGKEYIVFGRVNEFNGRFNITHPEMEETSPDNEQKARSFDPVYPSTDKLTQKGLDAKGLRKLMRTLLDGLSPADLPETLPDYLTAQYKLVPRWEALSKIHFPETQPELDAAIRRLKFEELFFLQLRLLQIRTRRKDTVRGFVFSKIGDFFNKFFQEKLPFELTGAQKRVLKEIRADLASGKQMNRLVQGDVGSGKTIVALMTMLMALDNGFQACLMAPTEILAQQHFANITELVGDLGVNVGFLSGTVKGKKREAILEQLASGELHIVIGTHALIEDWVQFKNLGISIIDEQHRFGVEQRAALWKKNPAGPPHVLVMTATPIPRTLAMTLYGDLDVSVIDELPPGRKPITTIHKNEHHRLRVQGFMRDEIAKGRQVYVVYPMIEETETLDLQNLMSGFEALSRDFPPPQYQISIVHGKMKAAEKDFEMQRFVRGETQIMVATTVIEVGVNVPNASVMVIENAERFGLSQLHQLRGRVGRGAEQSFCILMTSFKLSADSRERIQTMVQTNDGFVIAETDLRLRGPGNIEGTQQSGMLRFLLADLARDGHILTAAREIAMRILEADPNLAAPEHTRLRQHLASEGKEARVWSRIS